MLRAKDGSTRRGMQALLQWSAISTLIAVTMIATAIRGLAQPPDTQSDESIRVAKANDAKARPDVAAQQRQPAPHFQRPPFDPAAMAMSDRGGFIVRLGEILARSDLGAQAPALNESFIAGWKDAFPAADAPTWSLQDIEYIAGDFNLIVKRMSQPTDEQHPQYDHVRHGMRRLSMEEATNRAIWNAIWLSPNWFWIIALRSFWRG